MKRAPVLLFGVIMLLLGMWLRPLVSAGEKKKKVSIDWETDPQKKVSLVPIKVGDNEKADWATCSPPEVAVGIHLNSKGGGLLACNRLVLRTGSAD